MENASKLTIDDEKELVELALNGDGEAFGRIYDAYSSAIYRTVIFPRVRNENSAEEILQDTFMVALNKLKSFSWQDKSIFFWLRIIAVNKCHEWAARIKREHQIDSSVLEYFPDDSYNPEKEVLGEMHSENLRDRIDTILSDIHERYSEAIRMRLKENLSREDCAKKLNVSVETFDVIFFRACRTFREAFSAKFDRT